MKLAKRLAARLPRGVQVALKRRHYGRQIRHGTFVTDEPELKQLSELVRPGDWAIDIGANIGHYTCALSRLVGERGRVLSFEPLAETFELLSSNVHAARLRNVSLFNVAISSAPTLATMSVPKFTETGLDNLYQARLAPGGEYPVLCLPLDAFPLPARVRLVKIDAEGHDLEVLKGMEGMVSRDRPVLIVEAGERGPIRDWIEAKGYSVRKTPGSPNIVAHPPEAPSGVP